MNAIRAVVRNGRIETDEPLNLPEGTELVIPLPDPSGNGAEDYEEGWDTSPEGISAWLRWSEGLEPLTITPAEEADAEAWLRKCDELGAAATARRVEELEG
jgi:hypothetical protein